MLPSSPFLVIRAVMTLACCLTWHTGEQSGISGALLVLYCWVEERYDRSAAWWATAVLACVRSLFER